MIYGQHGDLEGAEALPARGRTVAAVSAGEFNLALTYFQLNRFEDARAPLEEAAGPICFL